MDDILTRLYETHTQEQLDTLRQDQLMAFVTEEEKKILATQYWKFKVNVPVKVSLMRHDRQAEIPFWLESAGFQKTDLSVANDHYTYEVWQKDYPAGTVNLGINGWDRHRPVYFVSVAPLDPQEKLTITPLFPENQHFGVMKPGAFTYHDWDGLVLTRVPEALNGQTLLTTIRGRAREAHVLGGAFRKTNTPSSAKPDQVLLTWKESPDNSMTVSWRTSVRIPEGEVAYWKEGSPDTLREKGTLKVLQDRMLSNDRYVNRFTAHLKNLSPATRYGYRVKGDDTVYSFQTSGPGTSFSFVWFGDTHNDRRWGDILQMAHREHKDAEFYMIAGDLVNTGLHRDDWDKFFEYSDDAFAGKPLMAIPGNHDSQDGLGADLYRDLLPYPHNGPEGLTPGLTYSFPYKNALFLMIDAASFANDDQTGWIENQLKNSPAQWKLLFVHFPPFNEVEEYPELVEKWVPLFERYQLDLVISGHFHYYMRTYPMKGGKPEKGGTLYMTSVGTSAGREAKIHQPFVEKRLENGNFYQYVRIEENKLEMKVFNARGEEVDHFTLKK